MPKRTHPHNAEFQKLLHARGMTLGKLTRQMGPHAKTHVHLCQVVNGRRKGSRTMARLKEILPEAEWEAVKAFRESVLGKGIDSFVEEQCST